MLFFACIYIRIYFCSWVKLINVIFIVNVFLFLCEHTQDTKWISMRMKYKIKEKKKQRKTKLTNVRNWIFNNNSSSSLHRMKYREYVIAYTKLKIVYTLWSHEKNVKKSNNEQSSSSSKENKLQKIHVHMHMQMFTLGVCDWESQHNEKYRKFNE